ncbi:Peptidyl-prolyl isomerase cwc27 [Nowakowskiella sp. JEL0078]|nr:Peptidyl-prolyl isomerase cwc27 [Nowakowskiella sp. JEL0078]
MSNAYVTEPPTKGKVILKTTAGELEIEILVVHIFSSYGQKRFRKLAETLFNFGFIVQGGDPTGTGLGGESIYGEKFSDEFHSRLRFSHRGLLAMANTGPNENGSQFFFTLDRTDELHRKNTIFGKVVGNTLFNLLKIGESETDKDERPLYPAKILSAHVINNPFDDIEPRTTPELRKSENSIKLVDDQKFKIAKKKNIQLLSFGEDFDSSKNVNTSKKIRSSHDVLEDSSLSKEIVDLQTSNSTNAKRKYYDKVDVDNGGKKTPKLELKTTIEIEKDEKLANIRNEIEKVQMDISKIGNKNLSRSQLKEKKVSLIEEVQKEFLSQGTAVRHGRRNKSGNVNVYDQLKIFKKQLKTSMPVIADLQNPESEWRCQLHERLNCESCRDTFGEEDDDDGEGWIHTSLKFEKAPANVYEPKLDDYVVEDFRELRGEKGDSRRRH